jgi:hypothetical protein
VNESAWRRFPVHGVAGFLLVASLWPLNWLLDGPRTHILFFPLWLGYILAIDGITFTRRGNSVFTRSRREFVLLFLVSAPAWWIFELFNWRTRNWAYQGAELFSDLEYAVLATIAFSTVMPAVFVSAELVRSLAWVDALPRGPKIRACPKTAAGFFAAGVALVLLIWTWPVAFYPLVWGSMFCLLEPVNFWLRRPSILERLELRDWRPVVSLALGALICGFFWEFWNYYSYPKWTYHTPGVNFFHVFEMPLLGYIGYLPFALELFALGHLLRGPKLNVDI